MMKTAIMGAQIWHAGAWRDDVSILVQDGVITALLPAGACPQDAPVERLEGGYLLPGFIDTQVNGGGGVLFNDAPTLEGVEAIAAAHGRFGTTALLPTLISDEFAVIEAGIRAIDAAITAGVPGVIGVHIEGPFLNPDKHGIHDATKFRSLDDAGIALLTSLKRGKTLVTLAPELAPPGAIRHLVARGVIVAAGHTRADYETMQRSIEEGLSGVTHLFNAMTQLEGRAPGVVGAAMEGALFTGIIADGHHVHPAALRAAFRSCGPERLMLVTDAMPSVGGQTKGFRLGAQEITEKDGALRSADGTLAGSALDMASALRNAAAMMRVSLETASQMASQTPAAFLGLSERYGRLCPGARADMVHVDDALAVQGVWIAGRRIELNARKAAFPPE
jgi:N-acetylglucosamine-6-phosphate deacetylase